MRHPDRRPNINQDVFPITERIVKNEILNAAFSSDRIPPIFADKDDLYTITDRYILPGDVIVKRRPNTNDDENDDYTYFYHIVIDLTDDNLVTCETTDKRYRTLYSRHLDRDIDEERVAVFTDILTDKDN